MFVWYWLQLNCKYLSWMLLLIAIMLFEHLLAFRFYAEPWLSSIVPALNLRLLWNNMGSRRNKIRFFFLIFQVNLDQTVLTKAFLFCLWLPLDCFTVEWHFRLGWFGWFSVCVEHRFMFWAKFWFFHAASSWFLPKLLPFKRRFTAISFHAYPQTPFKMLDLVTFTFIISTVRALQKNFLTRLLFFLRLHSISNQKGKILR